MANIIYGTYRVKLPNGEVISNDYISISGPRGASTKLRELFPGGIQVGDSTYEIIPQMPGRTPFTDFEPGRRNDAERKLAEHILGRIQNQLGRNNFKPGNNYQNAGFEVNITVNSEMSPCPSCEKIIVDQLPKYFGDSLKVKVKYGIEFKE